MTVTGEKHRERAVLALADGTVFHGYAIGAFGETAGEVVFNTSMYGYQEILSDPSYKFQILTFTYPHIGNVGVNEKDIESEKVQAAGLIVREFSDHYSNFRAHGSFGEYLKKNNVVGIGGIDTRALVLLLRTKGAQMGIICAGDAALKGLSDSDLVEKARKLHSMDGLDLTGDVTTPKPYDWYEGNWVASAAHFGVGYRSYSQEEMKNWPLVVAVDYGIKYNILRLLVDAGFRVKVVPSTATSAEILTHNPDGVFLSNGPGDPAAVTHTIKAVQEIVGKKPVFGICLGHQILGLALGAPTFKLKFGHRGGNHPVRDEGTGKVEITVQNHGFAVDAERVPKGLNVSHVNLNDGTVEGFEAPGEKAFSIQYHPESSPGPHDARYLFGRFKQLVETGKIRNK